MVIFDPVDTWKKTKVLGGTYELRELLVPVIRNGKSVYKSPSVMELRDFCKKEQDTLRDMKIVQEFYARGFEFLKIDLYQSDAIKFQVVEGKLLPPFSVIEGMGGIAAEALAVAAHAETERGEKFLSKDDIRQKAKVSQTVLDTMAELGLLGGLPESNQLSIFDFGF